MLLLLDQCKYGNQPRTCISTVSLLSLMVHTGGAEKTQQQWKALMGTICIQ